MSQLEQQRVDLEFDNFMYRVQEINNIVKKLASKDKTLNDIGSAEAEKFLKETGKSLPGDLDPDDVKVFVKNDKSVINYEAFKKNEDPDSIPPDQFMKEVERDANQRYKDKLMRKEKCETLKVQAEKAFRRGEYEKALSCYNKALNYVKDSPMLYVDKAVTLIKLKLYEEAVENCETALQLNENLLKAWLLLVKAHYLSENLELFEKTIKKAKEQNKNRTQFIEEFIEELKGKK